ncbi:MAG: class I SAM-dependent methyltransferase [Ignavibacteriales bacterium]
MNSSRFTTVTETPGTGATGEQLRMLYARYKIAGELATRRDVLEVACGPGIGLGYLMSKAASVVGGDYDPSLVEIAQRHYGDRVEVIHLDAQDMPFADSSFDVVLLLEALYYLRDVEKFLREARRVLRDGGTLFICSANKEWNGFNPSPFSRAYYSAAELGELMTRSGFDVSLFAGFPVEDRGFKGRVLRLVRLIAVRFHLIPRTMRGKNILKRILYGNLTPLPAEIGEEIETAADTPVALKTPGPVPGYKVIYAIGKVAT